MVAPLMNHEALLAQLADIAMSERGFIPEIPNRVLEEAAHLSPLYKSTPSDMRGFLWISIDNDDSLDLDQLTYAEGARLFVAIADVDAFVKKGSLTDGYAGHNTTSVYTPAKVYPMLPTTLCYDRTSLKEGEAKEAVVIEMEVGSEGAYTLKKISLAQVVNHAKLSYSKVAAFLEGEACPPPLAEQLTLQHALARKIRSYRFRKGALTFAVPEAEAVLEGGKVVSLRERMHTKAHMLIENFMIAANALMTHFFDEQKLPLLRRVVKEPKRWGRIVEIARDLGKDLPAKPDAKALQAFLQEQHRLSPDRFPDLSLAIIKLIGRGEYALGLPGRPITGHFDLGLSDYAHATAPNRRYPDLIMQRLLKSSLQGQKSPYTPDELALIARRCTEKEDDASKVERRMRKSAIALMLSSKIGSVYPAMVTGSTEKGVWVRLTSSPIEGRLSEGFQGCDVGDRLTVRLIHVDPQRGHIDFAREKK